MESEGCIPMEKVKTKKKTKITIESLQLQYKDTTELSYEQEYKLMKTLVYEISYYPVNKEVVKKYGWMVAGLLAMYIDRSMYNMKKYPQYKGWFYYTKKELCNKGHISDKFITYAKGVLVQGGMITSEFRGLPAKEWLKINPLKLMKMFASTEEKIKKVNERTNADVRQAFEQDVTSTDEKDDTSRYPKDVASRIPKSANKSKTIYTKIKNKIKKNAKAFSDTGVSDSVFFEIISFWNTLPNVTKHKLDPNSKTIQSSIKMLSALLQGIPIVNIKHNLPRKELRSFFQAYKIDENYLRKKWTVQEINTLLRTAVANKNKSKESGKMSLPNLLWNEFASRNKDGVKTVFSWFYYSLAIDNTPAAFIEMAQRLAENLETKNPPILKWGNALYNFSISDERTAPFISTLLDWYLHNKNNAFMIVVRDMEEFIFKFTKIIDSRERMRTNTGRNRLYTDEPIEMYDALGNVLKSN